MRYLRNGTLFNCGCIRMEMDMMDKMDKIGARMRSTRQNPA